MTASPGVTATTAGLHLHSRVSPSRPQSWIQDGVSSGQTPLLPAVRVSGSQVADPLQPGSGFVSTHEAVLSLSSQSSSPAPGSLITLTSKIFLLLLNTPEPSLFLAFPLAVPSARRPVTLALALADSFPVLQDSG